MLILGVDPGLADTGWAILEGAAGQKPALRSSGIIRTPAGVALAERLIELHVAIMNMIATHKPESMAVEEMFFMKAADSVRASLQARGVILLAAAQAKLPVIEYNPRQVKSTLTGSGTAAKDQMQRMVQRTLGLESMLKPDDVSDAAAIALCHLRLSRFKRLRVLETLGGRKA